MFGYYLTLALCSLRRSPALTALMIVAIGVGIGISMTTLAIFRTAAGNPIPGKSAELFAPQIDNCGDCRLPPMTADRIPVGLTYRDAMALMSLHAAAAQAVMYPTAVAVTPPDPQIYPLQVVARATGADFFPMFDVPFRYGAPWGRQDDAAHAAVVVLSRALNDRLFGGADSVGRTLRVDTQDYRIVGVTDTWQPVPRFYDVSPGALTSADALFMPFTRAVDLQLTSNSMLACRSIHSAPFKLWQELQTSECTWVQLWVELPTAAAVQRYTQLLTAYATEQRLTGRFQWPTRVRLRDVNQWLRAQNVVPAQVRIAVIVAFALLVACLVNAMGIILARFLPRALDVSVRRATGATRSAIFLQSLIEVGMIGVLGAGLGLLLSGLGLRVSRLLLPVNLLELVRFDGADAAIAVALSILATLLAGLYPTWRMSRVQPAFQLKVQ